MIVHSMTPEEKFNELKSDLWSIEYDIKTAVNAYGRDMIKLSRSSLMRKCPLAPRRFKIKSRNHNDWTVVVYMRGECAMASYYVTVPGEKKTYFTCFGSEKLRYLVREFTPHFMQRYRERLLLPSGLDLSGGPALENYMMRTGNAVDYEDENGINYSVSKHGFVISQFLTPQYLLMKTYIAKDDTFSRNKAYISDRMAGFLDFILFISNNRHTLTYEIVEEQLRKCDVFTDKFMKAYAEKFRPGRPIRYEDFEAFRCQQFALG